MYERERERERESVRSSTGNRTRTPKIIDHKFRGIILVMNRLLNAIQTETVHIAPQV
jgi:hypothetical protein